MFRGNDLLIIKQTEQVMMTIMMIRGCVRRRLSR